MNQEPITKLMWIIYAKLPTTHTHAYCFGMEVGGLSAKISTGDAHGSLAVLQQWCNILCPAPGQISIREKTKSERQGSMDSRACGLRAKLDMTRWVESGESHSPWGAVAAQWYSHSGVATGELPLLQKIHTPHTHASNPN